MKENNKYDALEEIFYRKLENHQASVDSSDWEVINCRLHGKSSSKKKSIVVWSAVAASLAIIVTLAHLNNNTDLRQLPKNQTLAESLPEYIPGDTLEYTEPAPIVSALSYKAKTEKNNSEKNETPDTNATVISGKQESIAVFQKEPEKQSTKQQSGKYSNKSLFTLDYPSSAKKELLLAASFGTSRGMGNNTIIQFADKNVSFSPGEGPSFSSGEKIYFSNNELIPENTDGEYSPPLSFGLTIRKNLNPHWGIETGLVYTYLSSNYRWNDFATFDALQQLHYLGIPVNGIVYLWNNNPKWNAYLSFGAMLEKGLWMKTVRNRHLENYIYTTTQKSDIDGWQWSLNGSLGISYRFTKKIELYVEPRLSYYFDSDQPMSIRTDWPVSAGVGGGLRYSF